MLLHNLYLPGRESVKQIHIIDKKIKAISPESTAVADKELPVTFKNAVIFPGFINSHEHLDFNCYPALGRCMYNNYKEWGADIHLQFSDIIRQVLTIPLPYRTQWGLYKNLLNGVTTVVNHGLRLNIPDELITVFQDCSVLHSVQFEKNWKWKLNNPFRSGKNLAMHVGEGTDELAHDEIDELIRWNLLKRKITGIHGVAMTPKQAKHFKALVWCPASNYFLLNATARVDELKIETELLFGTDSTLTASWNLWEHLRLAKQTGMVTNEELIHMLTNTPAAHWELEGLGMPAEGSMANLVVAEKKYAAGKLDGFWNTDPWNILMVIHAGSIVLFDSSLQEQLSNGGYPMNDFSEIHYPASTKFVKGDLPGLVKKIKEYYPGAEFPFLVD